MAVVVVGGGGGAGGGGGGAPPGLASRCSRVRQTHHLVRGAGTCDVTACTHPGGISGCRVRWNCRYVLDFSHLAKSFWDSEEYNRPWSNH